MTDDRKRGGTGFQPRGRKAAPAGGGERVARVAERVRTDLAQLFLSGALHDPVVQRAIVSSVVVTNDLSLARVFVRLADADVTDAKQRALLGALERAKGFIRRELAASLDIRSVPELRFAWDDAVERGARIDALLDEVAGKPPRGDS